MQAEDAMDFYNRVVKGTKEYKTITLEHKSGSSLEGVEMHPVDKRTLAAVIERLPESLFEAVEDAEGDAEAAEEEMDGDLSGVTEETVAAFEEVCIQSIEHPDLAPTNMKEIISELNFEVLFELGTEIIDLSIEQTGDVKDFHEQG